MYDFRSTIDRLHVDIGFSSQTDHDTTNYSHFDKTTHGLGSVLRALELIAVTSSSKHDLAVLCQHIDDPILEFVRVDKIAFRAFFCSAMDDKKDTLCVRPATSKGPAASNLAILLELSASTIASTPASTVHASTSTTSLPLSHLSIINSVTSTPRGNLLAPTSQSFFPWTTTTTPTPVNNKPDPITPPTPVSPMTNLPISTESYVTSTPLVKRELPRIPVKAVTAYKPPYYYPARPYYGPRVHDLPYGW